MSNDDSEHAAEIKCCDSWIPYPEPGNPTQCRECWTVFSVDKDAVNIALMLGARFSPALFRDPDSPLEITAYDCAICSVLNPGTPCICHTVEFGSPEYFARLDKLHGRQS